MTLARSDQRYLDETYLSEEWLPAHDKQIEQQTIKNVEVYIMPIIEKKIALRRVRKFYLP